jgi:hypothetical protein
MGSVVIGGQRPLDMLAAGLVVPDAHGHGQQPLGDAGIDSLGGPAAVAFEVELALEGVVDRFDPLPDPADRSVPGRLVAAVGRTRCSPSPVVTKSSKSWPAKPLSPMRIPAQRVLSVR